MQRVSAIRRTREAAEAHPELEPRRREQLAVPFSLCLAMCWDATKSNTTVVAINSYVSEIVSMLNAPLPCYDAGATSKDDSDVCGCWTQICIRPRIVSEIFKSL